MLRDDDLGAALIQRGEIASLSKALSAISASAGRSASRQERETNEIAERVGQRQDFGGHPAFRAPDGLALSPPFALCPWRWTLTMAASIMAYSMSCSSWHLI